MLSYPSGNVTVRFAAAYIPVLENVAISLDLKALLKQIVEAAVQITMADKGLILLLDKENNELYPGSIKGFEKDYFNGLPCRAKSGSIEERVIERGLPVLIGPKSGRNHRAEVKNNYLASAMLSVPIKRGKNMYGILTVYTGEDSKSLTESDYKNLYPLAGYTAIAIANAHRYRETDYLLGDAYVLFDMAETLTKLRDLKELLDLVADHTLQRLEAATQVFIHLRQPNTGQLECKVCLSAGENYAEHTRSGDVVVSEALIEDVLEKNRTLNISPVEKKAFSDTRSMSPRSLLVSPISGRDISLGTITVSSQRDDSFRLRDERFLSSLANLVAVAIENIRLFEAERISRQKQAEAEKIAAMGDIAGNILHKVNGQISGIRPLVQLIREELDNGTLTTRFLSERLSQIETSATQTLKITRSIHKPFEPLEPKLIKVNTSLIAALEQCKPLLRTIDLSLDLEKPSASVIATKQLVEVFQNLLTNAIEAMNEKGKGKLQITSRRMGSAVEIAIADSGPGLVGNLTAANIFDLGKSSKNDSLGYGLWWSKIYLKRIGGSIRLDQNVESGCRFIINLPLSNVS